MENQKSIFDLAQESYLALSSGGEWSDYLRSAAWNFRFNFLSQVMIWAQRPDARNCYSFDDWHDRFHRRVKRGSKGIALLDDRKEQLSISYVFDYNDTYSPERKDLKPWHLTSENESSVREALVQEFMPDALEITEGLDATSFYGSVVYMLLEDMVEDVVSDLMDARPDCRLSELSEQRAGDISRLLLMHSATAMVMYRCGLEPDFSADVFSDIQYFDSNDALSILGNASQQLASQILREIARTVAAWDKAKAHEEEKGNEVQHNVSAGRGVSDPESDGRRGSEAAEQVRQDAEEISAGTPPEPVHGPADVRAADGSSASSGRNDPGAGIQNDGFSTEEEPGALESQREPSLGTAHEDTASSGRRTGASGDYLRVNHFSNAQIEEVLLRGPGVENGKYRIQRAAEDENTDLLQSLRSEYGTEHRMILFQDGTHGSVEFDSKGVHFRAEGYYPLNVTWGAAAIRIRRMVDDDRYLDAGEKLQATRYFQAQEAILARQETGEILRVFAAVHGPKDHDFTNQLQEDLRAFIFEDSETARHSLLATFTALSARPQAAEDLQSVSVLSEALRSLGEPQRPEEASVVHSATDAGIHNPFPSEDELEHRRTEQETPLAPKPSVENMSVLIDTDPSEDPGLMDMSLPEEGDIVTLSGTDYIVLHADNDGVTLQDLDHPLFTQPLSLSVFQTILKNSAKNAVKENPSQDNSNDDAEKASNLAENTDTVKDIADTVVNTNFERSSTETSPEDPLFTAARRNYELLNSYAPYILDGTLDYVRFESDSYEPLYIERISDDEIAIAHTFIQNGDTMLDPEIVFHLDPAEKTLRALSFEQNSLGVYQRVYAYNDIGYHNPDVQLAGDIHRFFTTWHQNLTWQDHAPVRGIKYRSEGDREYLFQDGRPYLKEQPHKEVWDHNPEPEVDHPELVTDRHFPIARADKEILSDLLMFVSDYRSTFARNRPALSAGDQEGYDHATELANNIVVQDSVYANAESIRNLCNYINAWYLPFSDGLDPEFLDSLNQLLERAESIDPDVLSAQQQEQEREDEKAEETVAADAFNQPPESAARDLPAEDEGIYTEQSFHEGDYYEDQNTRGIITRVYIPEDGVPHESAFSIVDPDAPEDSRDAKGYVVSMPGAIRRLNAGNATLTPEKDRTIEQTRNIREPAKEPSLFDFQYDEPAGLVSEPTPREKVTPVPVQAVQSIAQDERINFRLPSETVPLGGPKARYQSNVAAIRLLKQLESEDRLATAQEQEVLSKYVGWGGIPDAFDPNKSAWSKEYEELKLLLTEEEYSAARESTLTAFYTPPEVTDAIYQVLGSLGFRRGNILDPGCGTGSFSGRLPHAMSESKVYGVEKDSISGRIARQLYQKNNIAIEGYEDTNLPDNFFDVAVGNVPFGAFKVSDKHYDKLNLQIHDYFFAKTLDKVRPGGVIAFITSMGTMDKQNTEFRRYLSQRADLLGAIRLPNNTFKTNAGTDVTSDIIFLQKRELPRVEEAEWVNLDRAYDYDKHDFGPEMNAYFAYNPEMIMGEMREISGPHGPELACIAREGEDLKENLNVAASLITGAIHEGEQGLYDQEYEQRESIPADPSVRNYSFTLVDGDIYFREDSEMFKVETSKKGEERIRGLVGLRDIVHKLIEAQVDGEPDEVVFDLQRQLNDAYDAFTAKNGLINSRGNDLAFSDDSSYYLLCSLEHVNEKGEFLGKADMFYKRTIHANESVEHVDTAQEALAVSIGERGRIDFDFMSSLSGLTKEQLIGQLQGHIFQDPTMPGKYEISALYLSGNVRKKLEQARAAEQEEPGHWQSNIHALESVQPRDLEPADIAARLGSTWIPQEDYTQFMFELLDTPHWYQENKTMEVQYSPITNTFNIKNLNWDNYNSKATTTYGTERMHAYRILENTLNLKDIKIYDTVYEDGKERRVLNENETLEAQEKQQLIKEAFREWLWKDPDRADRLCKAYNERFNAYVPPKFDGSMVQFHYMNPEVTMRPWQRDAVARIIFNGNTLLAHAVGAGKTWTMSAAAMELKHLGLCSKSLIVVPNHLVGQWASAIYDQYPNAKVLASTKKDFETKNRKKFCSRIATGDYDIVVIGHSQFERIPLSKERQEAGIQKEIDKVIDAITELKAENSEHFTIKQMERMKQSLQNRLDKLNNSKKRDDVITFEQLGVDRLFVDESHEYKNLFLYTKMQNVAGISQTDSQKASDMFLKCRYMDELTGNKGNIHATGTPLSNTMAELYATQRYLQHDLLEEMDLSSFDQWASTFGETVTSVELAPEGTGYRARTRFAKFFNIPELMSLYCQVADIQTADMLDLALPTPHYENVVVPATEIQKAYVKNLGERAQKIRNGSVRPEKDNMLKITSDGRKLALDQRLIDNDWPDNPNSKVSACADNIHRLWKEGADRKLTQLVFCDISTPNNKVFNVYDDLKEKLIAQGIPPEEIRFVHEANTDAQKEALFQQVRDGKVRVLMGSTGKMGTGTNVQDLLVAGHDLDCPWRPSDLEQRSGRVIRQHNSNDDVYMFRYVTEGTFDAYMYQLVENKQRFISQIYTSKPAVREAADVDEIVMSFAEIKALASGNPLIKERVEVDGDVQRLQLLKARHENAQYRLNRRAVQELPDEISKAKYRLAGYEKDAARIASSPSRTEDGHLLPVNVKGITYEQPKEAGEAILAAIQRAPEYEVTVIGSVRGFKLEVDLKEKSWSGKLLPKLQLRGPVFKYPVNISDSGQGLIVRINNVLDNEVPARVMQGKNRLSSLERELESAKQERGKPFPREAELAAKIARLEELTRQLDLDAREDTSSLTSAEEVHHADEPEKPQEKLSLDSIIQSAQVRQASQIHSEGKDSRSDYEHV